MLQMWLIKLKCEYSFKSTDIISVSPFLIWLLKKKKKKKIKLIFMFISGKLFGLIRQINTKWLCLKWLT